MAITIIFLLSIFMCIIYQNKTMKFDYYPLHFMVEEPDA